MREDDKNTYFKGTRFASHRVWDSILSLEATRENILRVQSVRGPCSTRRPNSMPPRGVALGFILIPVLGSEVCIGDERKQKEGNGSGTSRSVR